MLKKLTCLVMVVLSVILMGSAWAADTLWSVDIQGAGSSGFGQLDPPTLMEGIEPIYGYGNVWNAFNVAGHDLPALVNPSMALLDSEGNETLVTFSIFGNISGFSYVNTIPLVQDYLFVNAGNSDVSVTWSITGLKPGSSYAFYTYGGGVVGRDIGLTVDEDGDGDLGNNVAQNVPTDGYLFAVKASAQGSIIGEAGPGTAGEGNWSGFQLQGAYQTEASSGPSPESEATDVLRDAVLGWTPGEFAQTHDVYFGRSFDDVNQASAGNPLDVLVSPGQNAISYAPGRLEFGQTYYWRVDEVNGAPDRTVFKGDVWSFTVEPYALPIETITATASSANANMGPERTIDGSGLNALDQHSTEGTDMWLSAAGDQDIWIQYAFDRVYKLHEMWVWNSNQLIEAFVGLGVKEVVIEVSADGENWTQIEGVPMLSQAPGAPTYSANTSINFNGALAQEVRIKVESGYGPLGQYGLSELRFFYVPTFPREPQPAQGEVTDSADVTLTWRPGREAASHEVYLGTAADNLALVGTTGENSYVVSGLDFDQDYVWQIVEVNETQVPATYAGPIWSFSTPAYLVVDEFDQYNDNCDRIFFAWEDGLGHNGGSDIDDCDVQPSNGNGGSSIVGNASSPFAEQSTVRSGAQSMPLSYDNNFGPSESTLQLDNMDWTASGIQSLSLYFHGAAGNTGQLYVKINNAKVLYNGDSADIARALWQPWIIDLFALGGVLDNVQTLTIGVDGASAAGQLYIDEIRLYPLPMELITPVEPDAAHLAAHYALDGDANDSSGNGVNGVNGVENGEPEYGPGVSAQAIQLYGIDEFVDFGDPAWPSGLAARTLCAWGMTPSVDPGFGWLAAYGSPATGQAMFIGINGTGLYGGGYGDDLIVSDFWTVDEWRHIALTYDGSTARMYADGIEVASGPKNWNLVLSRAHIGRQVNDASEFWEGLVDDVRLYDTVLSQAEIAALAGRTAPMFKSF
jgi:hypothetical protein